MSFRRLPFQFSTTDPVERQRELEKRFGIGFPKRNNMFVDGVSRFSTGSGVKDSSASSSPRLQHRVPMFVEGYELPIRSSVDCAGSVPDSKKPNVRVIPIEVEGAETIPSTRQRTFSGPAGFAKECEEGSLPSRDVSPMKRSMGDLTKPPTKIKTVSGPRVYNIPIKVESADSVTKNSAKSPLKTKSPAQKVHPKENVCNESNHVVETKSISEQSSEPEIGEEQTMKNSINNAVLKIESILKEFKSYESGVKEYSGIGKDKQYRYLDEMLTRCMLRLDDIDTMGNEKVRSARKNAVKQVQTCVDMLEEKINRMKETEKASVAENEVKDKNVQEEVQLTEQVPEVSNHVDKIEANNIEMANSVTKDDALSESTEVTKLESPKDVSLNASETKTCEKLEDGQVNVDMFKEVSDKNNAEMIDVNVNSNPIDGRITESMETMSDTCQEVLHNVSEVKELDGSRVKEMSECPKDNSVENPQILAEDVVSQVDIEMNEIKGTSEIKAKTIITDTEEFPTIPNEEKEVALTDIPAGRPCETQADCHDHKSSQK